ncbi:inactive C-alpha-formylglycine-generating enzyme 2-like [Patiria miniata]|uniref:Sulfatase-modifying factor enzyme-like domain-containing protein n=1 Tax=Patiria miniata TaxID=46514 RepID=A0A914BP95_PATMI|nr:inactive C-alpha-formylglycine-generating enzyme 2-like [Patiria miniata]
MYTRATFLLYSVVISWVFWSSEATLKEDVPLDADVDHYEEMVLIKGQQFTMGTDAEDAKEGEGPARLQTVKSFKINRYPVTIASFRKFVKAKKYKTEAEKFGWSFVLEMFVSKKVSKEAKDRIKGAPWWVPVDRAYWRMPEGKGSTIEHRLNHPVVHVSLRDAKAFCDWHGWRLPTEMEWEAAARGGLAKRKYPWGNKFDLSRMNIWQGKFPEKNAKKDGYKGVSPVDAFPEQNEYDLYDMVGNVWEWTSSRFDGDDDAEETENTKYVLRGGSYIDSKDGSFNHQVRVTTRTGNTPDAGSDNMGFRCAVSVPKTDSQKPPKGKKINQDGKKQQAEGPKVIVQDGKKAKPIKPNPADLNGKKSTGRKKPTGDEL